MDITYYIKQIKDSSSLEKFILNLKINPDDDFNNKEIIEIIIKNKTTKSNFQSQINNQSF